MKYHSIPAVGVSSRTEYNIHEKEKVTIEQEGVDTTFSTQTIVDDVDVKCTG